ncbi:MAG: CRISPR-associated endonuclease Cas2 [Ignavibacteriae bacterium]|nr:CRISPR-associated endonuclease Cas2 [Ignavibacteriota bacterium]NOH00239.1 CRISPR-associated endonuclease Cas2 [Ignavibacteriota bacterium]
MYYLLVYDIASHKRLPKVLKTCRKYLYWVQCSVFEGELSNSQYLSLKAELSSKINKKEDSVIFYCIRTVNVVDKKILGIEKNKISNFI